MSRPLKPASPERTAAEEIVREALIRGRFRNASLAVAEFEAKQVRPRGIGIDWKRYDPAVDVRALTAIYTRIPGILEGVAGGALESLRFAAAMQFLWEKLADVGWIALSRRVSGLTQTRRRECSFSSPCTYANSTMTLGSIRRRPTSYAQSATPELAESALRLTARHTRSLTCLSYRIPTARPELDAAVFCWLGLDETRLG